MAIKITEDLIVEIKSFYKDHADLDKIVTDLSNGESLEWWADSFMEEDFPRNIKLADALYKQMREGPDDEFDALYGSNEDHKNNNLLMVLTAVAAVAKYLRMEQELTHIEVHRQAMAAMLNIAEALGVDKDKSSAAINKGIAYAEEEFPETKNYYRGFIKGLDAYTLYGADLGDLVFLLLLYDRICKEYEPEEIYTKYHEDIHTTIIMQFDCENILDETAEVVEEYFRHNKDNLFKDHPIKNKNKNKMALKITGNTKVKTLKSDFKKAFGLTIRVYDGRSFANDDATLASIRKNDNKGGELSPKRNMKVGNLEDKIQELFGIKTQISGSDDSYLCEDELTLAAAFDADEVYAQIKAEHYKLFEMLLGSNNDNKNNN